MCQGTYCLFLCDGDENTATMRNLLSANILICPAFLIWTYQALDLDI
jgi:hypothetical protein